MLTYYDSRTGRERLKRRYSWAAWGFLIGLASGVAAGHIL